KLLKLTSKTGSLIAAIAPNNYANRYKAEWHNMILFASDGVLIDSHAFICNPSYKAFRKASLSMRQDLWGGKLTSQLKDLAFD
ncbi:hypothetical protein C7271_03930, partial [filamentous cyanobacterium CCP5]